MTMEQDAGPKRRLGRGILPWLIAGAALVVYLLTLDRWVSFGSLLPVARTSGWTWQPDLYGPLYWLVTYPLRWLPLKAIPLALNLLSALCAVLTLALLARSVLLLPHDRTQSQRAKVQNDLALLSIRAAWLPPVLAAIVCGLQLTFWEQATVAGNEIFELLLFAYVIRCMLEFRIDERESWLIRAALVYGLAIPQNWAMIGFFPVFIMALVWIRGLSFFNPRFLGRMALCGAAGLSLYLLLPLVQNWSDTSPVPFWMGLKANVGAQRSILGLLWRHGRQIVLLLSLTSLVPIFVIGIRWASYFGDTSKLGSAMATFTFHVVHGLFLVVCIWVALDPPFSPRNEGFGFPFLTFYYLGALAVGYFSGYFLLVFSRVRPDRLRRTPPYITFINRSITAAVFVVFAITPVALLYRNLPRIRLTNGPGTRQFADLLAQALPPEGGIVLSDDARRLMLAQAAVAARGQGKQYVFVDTGALRFPNYHRFISRQNPRLWSSNPPKERTKQFEPDEILYLLVTQSRSNDIYYLHPSFGYYFEYFYPEPKGLVYKLTLCPTNSLFPPPLTEEQIAQNESFWTKAEQGFLQPLVSAVSPEDVNPRPNLLQRLEALAHLAPEPNRTASELGTFYSRALDAWGVEMQKHGKLKEAAAHFDMAQKLHPDNVVAQINLECNKKLQAGRPTTDLTLSKAAEDQFGKYRSWEQVMGDNGPFDEPSFCYEQGRLFVRTGLYRQATYQFDRVRALAPNHLPARLWLAQLFVLGQFPDEALKVVDEIHAHADQLGLSRTNLAEFLLVEASAYLAKKDLADADRVVHTALEQNPCDAAVLGAAVQAYMKYNYYSNAVVVLDEQIKCEEVKDSQLNTRTNVVGPLVNKGYALIQLNAFEQAIPPLTQALERETNSTAALLNRAIAYLRADKLAEARRDYETLQKSLPTAYQINFGLQEIAYRQKDTNSAIRNCELYLANAPTNTSEAASVIARLKELRPGSP